MVLKIVNFLAFQTRGGSDWHHLSELVLFALAMQETLRAINKHTFNNFQLRVGKVLLLVSGAKVIEVVKKYLCTKTIAFWSSFSNTFSILALEC